jgi:alpha-L-arabinofuranosidase
MAFKVATLSILLIPALAISYYFAVALPSNQRATLEFEKHKYEMEQVEKMKREAAAQEEANGRTIKVATCLEVANDHYNAAIRLNGTKDSSGFMVPNSVMEGIDRRKQSEVAECHRLYDK